MKHVAELYIFPKNPNLRLTKDSIPKVTPPLNHGITPKVRVKIQCICGCRRLS